MGLYSDKKEKSLDKKREKSLLTKKRGRNSTSTKKSKRKKKKKKSRQQYSWKNSDQLEITAMEEILGSGDSVTAINSSNIGFQLLKKQGWKEGTGLGISEQGRLEPVETHVKNNKRGLGADKVKKKTVKPDQSDAPKGNDKQEHLSQKKAKALSKRMRKMQEFEKKMQEKEFEREFFREFWPENV